MNFSIQMLVMGLVCALFLAGPPPAKAVDFGNIKKITVAKEPLPSYHQFDKKFKKCKKIPVVGKVCSPSLRLKGKYGIKGFTYTNGVPTGRVDRFELNQPTSFYIEKSVGVDNGEYCEGTPVDMNGFSADLCTKLVGLKVDGSEVSVDRIKLYAKIKYGKIKVAGQKITGGGTEKMDLLDVPIARAFDTSP